MAQDLSDINLSLATHPRSGQYPSPAHRRGYPVLAGSLLARGCLLHRGFG